MLTQNQIREFAKKLKISDSVVLREYIQLFFLKELYSQKFSEHIFFKGGTAIRLIFEGERFSEDLDFTVTVPLEDFNQFIESFFKKMSKRYSWNFKKRKTLAGETYLLSAVKENEGYGLFIKLDFSFREKVLKPSKSIIETIYPIIFTTFINHLSKEEILAEKIRAIITRSKGRDIYDLWFLLNQGIALTDDLVLEKLHYYDIDTFDRKSLIERIKAFGKDKFVTDLRPFVPINQRIALSDFYEFVIEFISKKVER